MEKYPIIENGEVVNVIMWDGVSPLPKSLKDKIDTNLSTPKKIGAKRNGNRWIDPPTPQVTEEQEFEQMIEELREQFKNRSTGKTQDIKPDIDNAKDKFK
jgi:hypothetical protein